MKNFILRKTNVDNPKIKTKILPLPVFSTMKYFIPSPPRAPSPRTPLARPVPAHPRPTPARYRNSPARTYFTTTGPIRPDGASSTLTL